MIWVWASVLLAQDEIPDRPEKIPNRLLKFEVPDPASLRVSLAGGAVAYLAEDHSLPLVEIVVYVRGGSFFDPPGKEGLAELTATVLRSGGTKSRTPRQLDDELDQMAAQISAGFGETDGHVSLSVLSQDLDKGLDLLADVLKSPNFRQEKIDLAKAQMLHALGGRNDRTDSIEARESNVLLYGKFPLCALPTKKSVESIGREDLLGCHERFFCPSNVLIAAAGDFRRVELAKKLDAFLSDWENHPAPALEIPPVGPGALAGVYLFSKEGAHITQGRVTIGHLGISLQHPDAFALRILNYIYGGGGFSSRLMQRVRSDEGLAYDVRSIFQPGLLYPGTMRIRLQSKSETCMYAAQLCLQELERMRKEGVKEQEVQEAIQYGVEAFPGIFATPWDTVRTFAQADLHRLPRGYYQTYRERLSAVTTQDCRRVANELLHPDKFVFVFVGNLSAIRAGDGRHSIKMEEFGPIHEIPLSDPFSLERPGR